MNDYITSFIRTYVPVAIGSVLAYAATRYGIVVDENVSAQVTAGLTGVIIAVYYFIARFLERRYPQLGWLLGSKAQPTYSKPN